MDRYWRKAAVDGLRPLAGERILDLATGTGDMALEIASRFPPGKILVCGADFSRNMLFRGAEKISQAGQNHSLHLFSANAETLPFANNSFQGATIAFGIRNFDNAERGLEEVFRTLAPRSRLLILEFSLPSHPLLRGVYLFYFRQILPWVGCRVSGNSEAYKYLPESVSAFPEKKTFIKTLEKKGFMNITIKSLTGGIVTLYSAYKNENSK
tara:strand:+ start:742 stop:1374 length:633 start_codon:yes stop_codon:yes gene_type:complete